MRIGEVARAIGVSPDTVRFYERAGLLPRARRSDNSYRDYGPEDVEHLRLLIELRRLDLPLDEAAQVARWCHTGHCEDSTSALPRLVRERRADIAARVAGLEELDRRLASLERHLERTATRRLAVVGSTAACCDAAGAALSADGSCGCCAPGPATG